MRHLGIDFGSKRVGLAMSDEQGKFAMPHSVLKNEKGLVDNILKIITSEKIEKIVLGESLNEKNQPNEIMEKINQFKSTLEKEISIPIIFEREYFSSQHAEFFQGKHDMLDAGAAAIILQRYLDKNNG